MKKFVMAICFLFLMTSFAYAQNVKAKILGFRVGERDYVWVDIEYDINGKKVTNSYPMDFKNVVGKTNAEIENWLDVNIKYQCDRYIETEFRKKINDTIIKEKLNTLVGKEYTKDTTILEFDVNNDNVLDKSWTVDIEGNYVEKNI